MGKTKGNGRTAMIVFFLLFSFQVFSAENLMQSKEKINFYQAADLKIATMGKIPEFTGIIERINPTAPDLKMVDVYQFKSKALKVDKKLCATFVEKMFAISKSKLYGIKSFKVVESNKGDICQYYISDKVKLQKKEEEYHRLVLIGFINTKAHAIVFHPDAVNDIKTSEALQFWNDLR